MALSALVAGWGLGRPVVLEVGDIRKAEVSKGITGFLIRLIERYTVNACKLLVVTAPGFVDEYYRKWVKTRTPALLMENKQEEPQAEFTGVKLSAPSEKKPLVERPLRIGYFGVLRCEWSWRVLEPGYRGPGEAVALQHRVVEGHQLDSILGHPIEEHPQFGDLPVLQNVSGHAPPPVLEHLAHGRW